jgi:hypothetical protein
MKILLYAPVVLFIVLFIIAVMCVNTCNKNINKEIDKSKEMVGKKVILEKDTLLILDYSLINSNYKLSDGREISFEFARKLKTIK